MVTRINVRDDLAVERISDALSERSIALVVSGSIGATESVRFVRALRRLGADVEVWLTRGALQFVTPTALEWASTKPVRTDFSGLESHIALADACIIAPASANFIYKISHGVLDTPCSALTASFLGAQKPVLLMPNMHETLAASPAVAENLAKLAGYPKVQIVAPRQEEGKHKFPDPAQLADECAHYINRRSHTGVVCYGGTQGPIDAVRFIGNYSSGALGSLVIEELYRQGFGAVSIAGPSAIEPRVASRRISITTPTQLMTAAASELANAEEPTSLIFMSAVLDYLPVAPIAGKIKSGAQEGLKLELRPTEKILPQLSPSTPIKVGFKLEHTIDADSALNLAERYMTSYNLSMFIVNAISEVGPDKHRAFVFTRTGGTIKNDGLVEGKLKLAQTIVSHLRALTI